MMQCNPMLIERWRNKRSSEDVRWRSFLRWGTVKVKLLETNAPQKILMIRFETKTWLMENQVKLSCFSPVVFIWKYDCSYSDVYLIKISQDLTEKRHVKQQLKLDICTITLKDLWLDKSSKLWIRDSRRGVDWVWQV